MEQPLKIKSAFSKMVFLFLGAITLNIVLALGIYWLQINCPIFFHPRRPVNLLAIEFLFTLAPFFQLYLLWFVRIRKNFMSTLIKTSKNTDDSLSKMVQFFGICAFIVANDGTLGSLLFAYGSSIDFLVGFWGFALILLFLLFPSHSTWEKCFINLTNHKML